MPTDKCLIATAARHGVDHCDAEDARGYLVVFASETSVPWLRLLRPGFRHCFLVVRMHGAWVSIDSLKTRLEVDILPAGPDFDLARFYAERGFRVLVGRRPPLGDAGRFGLRPLTCVEVVKRALALHAPRVLTPWQLWRHLLARGARAYGQS
ncbi:hypothetical protein [Marinivivus vitaminiproducens]|uniref:hypothetical protein n=1 Tax=Marinivivus vitaminiproducens TaxID=3035935 RepID=UPI00279C0D96|nr:hypothetical protein P4R82_04910 [Geminicoccaceae bacterium SCSIO 64248]